MVANILQNVQNTTLMDKKTANKQKFSKRA